MNDQEYLAQAGITDAEQAPIETPAPAPEAQPQTSTPPTPQEKVEMYELAGNKYPGNAEFKLNHGGKILNVPISKALNTYRQWQHLQDKWNNDYKPKITEFESLRPQFDQYKQFYDKYGQLQTWSEQNPKDWETLWNLYQNKDQHLLSQQVSGQAGAPAAQNPNAHLDPLIQKISGLEQTIQKLQGVASQYETSQQQAREAKDVEHIKGEISTFKTEFPEINMDEPDPDGIALWAKIVQWGSSNGYREFEPAARVFLKERIADAHQQRARAEVMKTQKNDHSQGVIKRSATPFQGQETKPLDVRKMSYSQIAEAFKDGRLNPASNG